MTITDYNFDIETKRITNKIKNKEVLERWIQRALMIERNAYPSYSSEYGVEFQHLKGKYVPFVVENMKKTIKEVLRCKSEINGIYDYDYQIIGKQQDAILLTFTVDTIYGIWKQTTRVEI